MKPLVSVVMPAYNAERFIRETIDSILNQTYRKIELVIVDDGSTDNTYKICEEYARQHNNIRILSHEHGQNRGKVTSRQLGIDSSNGSYIAFCDADDSFYPDKIEKQIERFRQNEDVIMVHTGVDVIGGDDRFRKNVAANFNFADITTRYHFHKKMKKNRICNSSALVRKSALSKIDYGFNKFFHGEDYVIWALLGLHGPFLFLPDVLTQWRYHDASVTAKRKANPLLHFHSRLESFLIVLGNLRFIEHPFLKMKMWRRTLSTMSKIMREYRKTKTSGG